MKSRHLNPHRTAALFALSLGIGLGAGMARADERGLQPQQMLPQYRQECAACHLAYPPGMLPARSWNRIMGGLDRHYGTDASLDAATVAQIGKWLEGNAGTYKRVSEAPPDDRITRSAWLMPKLPRPEVGVMIDRSRSNSGSRPAWARSAQNAESRRQRRSTPAPSGWIVVSGTRLSTISARSSASIPIRNGPAGRSS